MCLRDQVLAVHGCHTFVGVVVVALYNRVTLISPGDLVVAGSVVVCGFQGGLIPQH